MDVDAAEDQFLGFRQESRANLIVDHRSQGSMAPAKDTQRLVSSAMPHGIRGSRFHAILCSRSEKSIPCP